MTEFLKEYLLDPTKTNELIPGTLSINSPAINSQIEGYNTELQRYMKLNSRVRRTTRSFRISATDWLPHAGRHRDARFLYLHVADPTGRFTKGRGADQSTNILGTDAGKTDSGHVRQQKIKEELYLYLLNKREENAITMVITESNSRTSTVHTVPRAPCRPIPC